MNLYRLKGRAERFSGCGMLFINPVVSPNIADLKKKIKPILAKNRQENKRYHVFIEILQIKDFNRDMIVELLQTEDTEAVVATRECMETFTFDGNPPET